MSRVGKGVMEITINGQDYTLKATIAAIEAIEQKYKGGIVQALNACMQFGLNDPAFVISKGAGLSKDGLRELKENIIADGLEVGTNRAAEYLNMLMNPEGSEASESEGES